MFNEIKSHHVFVCLQNDNDGTWGVFTHRSSHYHRLAVGMKEETAIRLKWQLELVLDEVVQHLLDVERSVGRSIVERLETEPLATAAGPDVYKATVSLQ